MVVISSKIYWVLRRGKPEVRGSHLGALGDISFNACLALYDCVERLR